MLWALPLKHSIVIRMTNVFCVFMEPRSFNTVLSEIHSEITDCIRRHIGREVHVSGAFLLLLRKLVTRDENSRALHCDSAHSTAHLRVKRHADSYSGSG